MNDIATHKPFEKPLRRIHNVRYKHLVRRCEQALTSEPSSATQIAKLLGLNEPEDVGQVASSISYLYKQGRCARKNHYGGTRNERYAYYLGSDETVRKLKNTEEQVLELTERIQADLARLTGVVKPLMEANAKLREQLRRIKESIG